MNVDASINVDAKEFNTGGMEMAYSVRELHIAWGKIAPEPKI